MAKGHPKTGGRDFVKGDPRCYRDGRPQNDVRVQEIKADIRNKLITMMQKYFELPCIDAAAVLRDPKLTLGEKTAFRFWEEAARKGDHSKLDFIATVVNLKVQESKVTVEGSLESLVAGSMGKEKE